MTSDQGHPTPDPADSGLEIVVIGGGTDRALVLVHGEIDIANTHLLSAALEDQFAAGRRILELDLSGVTYASCGAVRAIEHAYQRCQATHGRLVITRVSRIIERILRLTGLHEMLCGAP